MIKKLLEKKVTYLFLFCIAFVLSYQFFLIKFPEVFPFAYELGDIQYRICFAFITSYIFYVLITFIPKEKDKKNVYEYINPKKDELIKSIESFFAVLVETANYAVLKDPKRQAIKELLFQDRKLDVNSLNEKDIKDICKIINPNGQSPINVYENKAFVNQNWAEYIKYSIEYTNQQIADIFVLMPHLDTKHIKLLSNLKDIEFIRIVRIGKIFDLMDSDIEIFDNPLYTYYQYISKLKEDW
jgi:hypothetical protein